MHERKMYKDYCPKGGLVKPARCSTCDALDWSATQKLWTKKDNSSVACTKDSKVEEITGRGKGREKKDGSALGLLSD